MTSLPATPALAALVEGHPEWEVWLSLLRVAREAMEAPAWRETAPAAPTHGDAGRPLVDGSALSVDARATAALTTELWRRAGQPPLPDRAAIPMLEAAVSEDTERLRALATDTGADEALLGVIASLAAMPLLHACRRAWHDRVSPDWTRGSCPVCGALATLAEARGLERALRLRCGRCGADWPAEVVRCVFCGTADHERLEALVADKAGDTRRVDACTICGGYLKTVATLTACPAADVTMLDLVTVDLDVAAMEHGFVRPVPPPHAEGVRITARRAGRWWRR